MGAPPPPPVLHGVDIAHQSRMQRIGRRGFGGIHAGKAAARAYGFQGRES
jgi:hypothetical protein